MIAWEFCITGFDISYYFYPENRCAKKSNTSDGVNGSSVLLLPFFISCSYFQRSVLFVVLYAIQTERDFTRITVHFKGHVGVNNTILFFRDVAEFLWVCQNIMVCCREIFCMVICALGTQITSTRFTIVFSFLLTLGTLLYYIWVAFCIHSVCRGYWSQNYTLFDEKCYACNVLEF